MAYKPRIESNNLDLTSILSTIKELPDAGPSVETCRLRIIKDEPMTTIYTGLIDGAPGFRMDKDTRADIDVDNCICNSVVICFTPYNYTIMSENASLITDIFAYLPGGYAGLGSTAYGFRITAPPGGTATISLEEDL